MPLPNSSPRALEVAKVDDELVITVGLRRRAMKLPRGIVPLDIHDAKFEADCLVIRFLAPEVSQRCE